jgi:hypothetical protein
VGQDWKADLDAVLAQEDHQELLVIARRSAGRVLRHLIGRLYSAEEIEKWRAVRALGSLAGNREIVTGEKLRELLRRFFWALNDESGAVPYGVPEAIGEVLAVRPELQEEFLPNLCAMVTEEEMSQTGAIERGVFWALGRVGSPVARCSTEAAEIVVRAAQAHPDATVRETARWAAAQLGR